MTNFTRYGPESRPYWPGGGTARGGSQEHPGSARHGQDRARRVGCGTRTPGLKIPPLQAPAGPSGPASLYLEPSPSSGSLSGWVPGIAHPGTHPYTRSQYPPGPHHPPVTCTTPVTSTLGTCTYDRFSTPVGEPRGSRTHPALRVPGRYIRLWEVYTAV